jgi:hypothetical protein
MYYQPELNCFLNNGKKAKSLLLAPIEAEILVSRGAAHKIKADCFASSAFSLVCGAILAENA